jgi:hypothetical protein
MKIWGHGCREFDVAGSDATETINRNANNQNHTRSQDPSPIFIKGQGNKANNQKAPKQGNDGDVWDLHA